MVLGGHAAISAAVESQLTAFGAQIQRRSGPDRYATSASVTATAFPDAVDTVLVATGEDYPDALAAVAAAGAEGAPLLLVHPERVPDPVAAELGRLRPRRILLLGGQSAVSTATEEELWEYVRTE